MSTKTITFKNDFHGTECNIRLKDGQTKLTRSQMRRIDRVLCGMADCTCGTIRGQHDFDFCYVQGYDHDYYGTYEIDL